jgi:glycerol kinase
MPIFLISSSIHGLTLKTNRHHICRAAVESICFQTRMVGILHKIQATLILIILGSRRHGDGFGTKNRHPKS